MGCHKGMDSLGRAGRAARVRPIQGRSISTDGRLASDRGHVEEEEQQQQQKIWADREPTGALGAILARLWDRPLNGPWLRSSVIRTSQPGPVQYASPSRLAGFLSLA